MKHEAQCAIALRVNDNRFFRGIKNHRIITAWSLPSAKLYAVWQGCLIDRTEKLLKDKNKKVERVKIIISDLCN